MSCTKRSEKKYLQRPSPPFSAQDCPNMIKVGNKYIEYSRYLSMEKIFNWHQ